MLCMPLLSLSGTETRELYTLSQSRQGNIKAHRTALLELSRLYMKNSLHVENLYAQGKTSLGLFPILSWISTTPPSSKVVQQHHSRLKKSVIKWGHRTVTVWFSRRKEISPNSDSSHYFLSKPLLGITTKQTLKQQPRLRFAAIGSFLAKIYIFFPHLNGWAAFPFATRRFPCLFSQACNACWKSFLLDHHILTFSSVACEMTHKKAFNSLLAGAAVTVNILINGEIKMNADWAISSPCYTGDKTLLIMNGRVVHPLQDQETCENQQRTRQGSFIDGGFPHEEEVPSFLSLVIWLHYPGGKYSDVQASIIWFKITC